MHDVKRKTSPEIHGFQPSFARSSPPPPFKYSRVCVRVSVLPCMFVCHTDFKKITLIPAL